jgi:hypothetical protein
MLGKQTTTSHFKSLNTKKNMTYADGNPGPGLGRAQKCGRIKVVYLNKILQYLHKSEYEDA